MSFDEVYNVILSRNLKHFNAKKSVITGKAMAAEFKFRTNNPKQWTVQEMAVYF